uniref:HAT C-terminal dimerisation domain-containing protein n=1 Tax=Acanthochromis polyacanthus TaxID=80966 RepID=A0A3Q1GZ72_9TELE
LLITYVRLIDADDLKEDLLFCKRVTNRATAKELFKIIDTYLKEADLKWEDCVGICTDRAQAMSGKRGGLQARLPQCAVGTLIHREALPSKQLNPELNDIMTDITAIVNCIKTRPVKARIFAALCEEMGSDHTAVLFHSESRWLSRGKVLSRVFELRNELAHKISNNNFLMKLANLSDMFQKLNELSLQTQGTHSWQIKSHRLQENWRCGRNETTSSTSLPYRNTTDFSSKTLAAFWTRVEKDYSVLGRRAMATLLPFATSYLCEIGFSAVSCLNQDKIQIKAGH